jgi:hypothetical protein
MLTCEEKIKMDAIFLLQIQLQHARQWLAGTTADVTDDVAHWTPPGVANPLGATYTHLVVSEDMIVNGLLKQCPPLFATSWDGRTGLSEPMPLPGPEWENYGSWARRVQIDLPALRDYERAVQANTDEYLNALSPADLDTAVDLTNLGFGEVTVGWVIGRLLIGHIDNECGEIACLKGLQGVRGYPG